MKKLLLPVAACAMIMSVYTSCSKSSSNSTNPNNNGIDSAQLSYQLKTTNPSASLRTTAAGTITWTSGFANPVQIKFEAKKGTSEIEYSTTAGAQVDLFSTTAVSFGSFSLPAGTYNEVELKIQLNNSGSNPALQLNGQFVSGSVTIPVTFTASGPVELKTEQNNVTIAADSTFTGTTTIDLSAITSGITATTLAAATLTGGTMVISASSNTAIYNTILNNMVSHDHHLEIENHH